MTTDQRIERLEERVARLEAVWQPDNPNSLDENTLECVCCGESRPKKEPSKPVTYEEVLLASPVDEKPEKAECKNYHLCDGIKQGVEHTFVGGGAGYPAICSFCGMKSYGFNDPSAFVNMIDKPEKAFIRIPRDVAEKWVRGRITPSDMQDIVRKALDSRVQDKQE